MNTIQSIPTNRCKARVIRSVGSCYDAITEQNQFIKCRLKGKFKLKEHRLTNPIAVGDWVEVQQEVQSQEYTILEILPRRNYIIRNSTHKKEHAHIVAANLDLALLVVSLYMPETSMGFIDRFLVAAESYGVPACLVINKVDLLPSYLKNELQQLESTYRAIGYPVFLSSATQLQGIQEIKYYLQGKITAFSGHSGSGKSTLINALTHSALRKTAPVSAYSNKGVHTTTFSELIVCDASTGYIDTPGIKEFGLFDIRPEELSHFFPEMRKLIGTCRFNTCTHLHEPGCAVIEKVQAGNIAWSRYKSYVRMFEATDNRK